jgi:uncharacterized protein YbcI
VADEAQEQHAIASAISEELVRVHEESYGAGVSSVETRVFDNTVMVLLDVELTPAEETLIRAGEERAVKDNREAFQRAIAPTFTAVVERATGRRVWAFASQMHTDPVFSVEIFRLSDRHD